MPFKTAAPIRSRWKAAARSAIRSARARCARYRPRRLSRKTENFSAKEVEMEAALLVLAVCTVALVIAFIIFAVVIWKMAESLRALTESCRKWVEIYFPPHINQAALAAGEQTSPIGGTKVIV